VLLAQRLKARALRIYHHHHHHHHRRRRRRSRGPTSSVAVVTVAVKVLIPVVAISMSIVVDFTAEEASRETSSKLVDTVVVFTGFCVPVRVKSINQSFSQPASQSV
jgi:hypothetical protein